MGIQTKTEEYILSLLQNRSDKIELIEKYAEEHHVPIMEPSGMKLLLQFLEIQKPKKILEVGTAIGYSAIRMGIAAKDATIFTLERDTERITVAKANIKEFNMENRIHIIEGDALELSKEVAEHGPYDVLFIDAAKGQYERFFTLFEPLVSIGGLIISDNVLFKGMVAGEIEISSKNTKSMVNKLRSFNEQRMADQRFTTMIYPVGDGVMVSLKNGKEELGGV
ncbi:O-methyltransferase [Evansella sp. AB-rgal1]|uniref:O-methyltransferase n=1 Tax=Evansella sp. AB-rgal1 TaxID=3242696 RepID=UPI00359D7057